MNIRLRTRFQVALAIGLLPAVALADALCQNCFERYRAPGGGDADSAGVFRLEQCAVCQKPDCNQAARHAAELKKEYTDLRWSYEKFRKDLAEAKRGGMTEQKGPKQKLADMKARLAVLEEHYATLEKKCPKEVPGTNVWDGTAYDGPVGEAPEASATDAARDARVAKSAADTYERMSQQEQEEFDTVNAFLGSKLGEYNPPDRGYNGSRYESTKTAKDVGGAYLQQSQPLTKTPPGKPKADLKQPVEPKFKDTKVARDGPAHVRDNGIAARARNEGNAYVLAFLQARDKHRQAVAAGDDAAAKTHSHSAVVFASQARGYAKWAADHQHKADAAHQKLLDERLAAAAQKGLTLPAMLEKFQTGIKQSGLPAHVADALTEAGATADDRAAVQARLLALTPAGVEAFLKDRRARVAGKAEVPDSAVLELQLTVAREAHHFPGREVTAVAATGEHIPHGLLDRAVARC